MTRVQIHNFLFVRYKIQDILKTKCFTTLLEAEPNLNLYLALKKNQSHITLFIHLVEEILTSDCGILPQAPQELLHNRQFMFVIVLQYQKNSEH